MPSALFALLLLGVVGAAAAVSNDTERMNYADLYRIGIEAYLNEEPQRCVHSILEALDEFERQREEQAECKRQCRRSVSAERSLDRPIDIEQEFLDYALQHAVCLTRCHAERHYTPPPSAQVDDEFDALTPLDYLQICFYRLGDLEQAANVAYSFLMRRPGHVVMMENLAYYVRAGRLARSSLVDRHQRDYELAYRLALAEYDAERWASAVAELEDAVRGYLVADEKCRARCDGPGLRALQSDEYYRSDVLLTIADLYVGALRCRRRCRAQLEFFDGQRREHLLAELFYHLQFAYYKMGETEASCRALESYRLFRPADEDALHNERQLWKEIESGSGRVDAEWLRARIDASDYYLREFDERSALERVERLFGIGRAAEDDDKELYGDLLADTALQLSDRRLLDSIGQTLRPLLTPPLLNGTQRFAFDGLIGDSECDTLRHLARQTAVTTDDAGMQTMSMSALKLALHRHQVDVTVAYALFDAVERVRLFARTHYATREQLFVRDASVRCGMRTQMLFAETTNADASLCALLTLASGRVGVDDSFAFGSRCGTLLLAPEYFRGALVVDSTSPSMSGNGGDACHLLVRFTADASLLQIDYEAAKSQMQLIIDEHELLTERRREQTLRGNI